MQKLSYFRKLTYLKLVLCITWIMPICYWMMPHVWSAQCSRPLSRFWPRNVERRFKSYLYEPTQLCFWCVRRLPNWENVRWHCSHSCFFLLCTPSICNCRFDLEGKMCPQTPHLNPLPVWRRSCWFLPDRDPNSLPQNLHGHMFLLVVINLLGVCGDISDLQDHKQQFCWMLCELSKLIHVNTTVTTYKSQTTHVDALDLQWKITFATKLSKSYSHIWTKNKECTAIINHQSECANSRPKFNLL